MEDNKTDVFLMREAIHNGSVEAEIEVVRDGQAATQYFDAADADETMPCPDLILLDMNLPKRSGDEVLKHLRDSARCRRAKVLIVSSSDAPQDHIAVDTLSVAGYFRKPSSYAEFMKLGSIVKELLERGSAST